MPCRVLYIIFNLYLVMFNKFNKRTYIYLRLHIRSLCFAMILMVSECAVRIKSNTTTTANLALVYDSGESLLIFCHI